MGIKGAHQFISFLITYSMSRGVSPSPRCLPFRSMRVRELLSLSSSSILVNASWIHHHHLPPPSKTSKHTCFRGQWTVENDSFSTAVVVLHRRPSKTSKHTCFEDGGCSPLPPPPTTSKTSMVAHFLGSILLYHNNCIYFNL